MKKDILKKLEEEIDEYQIAKTDREALEELANILELIHALAKIQGASIDKWVR